MQSHSITNSQQQQTRKISDGKKGGASDLILKGSIITLLSKVSMVFSGLGINFLVAKYYGASEVGIISLLNTIIGALTMVGVFGLNTAILKLIPIYLSDHSEKAAAYVYRKGLKLVNIVAVIVSLVLIAGSEVLAEYVFHKPYLYPYFIIAGIVLVPSCWFEYNSSALRALKLVTPVAVSTVLVNFLKFFSVLFLCIYDSPSDYLIYVVIFTYAILNIPLYFLKKKYFSRFKSESKGHRKISLSELSALSFPMLMTASATLTISYLDILMLGAYTDEKDIGIYSVCVRLAQVIVFVLASVNSVSASHFSELFNSGKIEELKTIVRKSTRIIILFSLPATVIYIAWGEFILSIFGKDFSAGYTALVLLVIGKTVSSACGSVGYLLNMTNYQNIYRNIVIVSCLVNILMNAFLIPRYGINGAAFTTMVSIIITNISALVFVRMKFGFWTF